MLRAHLSPYLLSAVLALGLATALAAPALAQESTAAALPLIEDELAELRAPVLVPEPTPEAVRYHRSGHWIWAASNALGIAVPALILWSGAAVALRSRVERIARVWPLAAALFIAGYFALDWLLTLPFAYYAGFVRQHAYGMSNQSLGQWLGDSAIGLGVNIVIATLFFWVPLLLIRRLPRTWWLATGALVVPFGFLIAFVQPIWIDPLTDDFGAMRDPQLEQRVLALADQAGIEGARVFEVAKSEDTNAVNAYVTGFGATKRIVLWDTLLQKLSPEETLVVMGHEMGHYVLRHVALAIGVFAGILTLALAVIDRAARALRRRSGPRLGLRGLADPAALPLVLMLAGVVGLFFLPLALAFSRHQEHEADRFALELTRDNRACALAFVALQTENLGYPRPDAWVKWMRGSHPALGERVDFCNAYRPWESDEPLRYARFFER
ncbi:MAG TPA: M48 family metallopeptidase [Myxococcota bacterium]|nr:M48 family metallopeptidase [Myxococcota bacterium]